MPPSYHIFPRFSSSSVPLAGLCFLERGSGNAIRPCSEEEAVAAFLESIPVPASAEEADFYLWFADKLLSCLPTYRLTCNQDIDARFRLFRADPVFDGERGKGLSEGQAQRIAIARALLRPAPILLLDEITSALDWETEKKILENLSRDRGERTIIISAHRPSVLAVCDRVYSIRDGRITEIPAAQAAEALHAQ